MQSATIVRDLNQMFAQPLRPFYQRRIVIWYDEENEFSSQLSDLKLDNAKVIVFTGRNAFAIKKLLSADDPTSNYLLYCPVGYECLDSDWLLDVKLYSESYQADLLSAWMEEMNLPGTPEVRSRVRHYRLFYASQERREKLASFPVPPADELELEMAVLCQICGLSRTSPDDMLRILLSSGLDEDSNPIYGRILFFQAESALWNAVSRITGYSSDAPTLLGLACEILITAASRTLPQDDLIWAQGLQKILCLPYQGFCYDFVSSWLHSPACPALMPIAHAVEQELALDRILSGLSPESLADTGFFPCVHQIILSYLMQELGTHTGDSDRVNTIVNQRRTCAFYEEMSPYYEAVLHAADIFAFYESHADGFLGETPKDIFTEYCDTFYPLDISYRLFHRACAQARHDRYPSLRKPMERLMSMVEELYCHWFLLDAGTAWTEAVAPYLQKGSQVPGIFSQRDFYDSCVRPLKTRTVVIVARSLRYEAATILAKRIHKEFHGTVSLKGCLSTLPTTDTFGMAAMLPHRNLNAVLREEGDLDILADGLSTRDLPAFLAVQPNSAFFRYDELATLKASDRARCVRGKKAVWILYSGIPDAGISSEAELCDACETAIQDLTTFVRLAGSQMAASTVYIISDHGFLATDSPLQCDPCLPAHGLPESGPRHFVAEACSSPLLSAKLLDGPSDWSVFTPMEARCFPEADRGFLISGGASLQEMVLPILEFHYLRPSSPEYQENCPPPEIRPVTLKLLSPVKKLTTPTFNLTFYQREAVSDLRVATRYFLFFVDEPGNIISDTHSIIADRTGEEARKRTFRLRFNLRNQTFRETDAYYLLIQEESHTLKSQFIPFRISLSPMLDQFSLFD